MREIKFRAWDGRGMIDHERCLSNGYSPTYRKLDFTWMQYTGTKDKNGVKCFSQDIVTDGINPPFEVELFNFPLMLRLSEIDFEIIGNIYQNPELLSEEQRIDNR